MGFNFPNAPTEGQIFAPAGGPDYVFRSGVWQGAFTEGATLTADSYNRVVNGAMQISQENGDTGSTSSTTFYMADQWRQSHNVNTVNCARASVVTPNKSQKAVSQSIGVATPSLAASSILQLVHDIEGVRVADFGWGAAGAFQAILRFWVKASPAGTYSVSIKNSATDRSFVATFTVTTAGAWQEVAIVIPGDVTGTWLKDTSVGMRIYFVWAAGSDYVGVAGWQAGNKFAVAGQTNGAATAGNTFNVGDVGLYLDPNATGVAPPWQMPDYASELAACQRYWCRVPSAVITEKRYSTAAGFMALAAYSLPATLRTAPTTSVSSACSYTNCTFHSIGTDTGQYLHRVDVTATGIFQGTGGTFDINARM